ncbi:glutamate receptor 2.1 [Rosa chinensis]|uniref:glutamate receptor 2.1 n=1 Tax=Rosa chinensis TaxID=74649 RepID=UPI001AD8B11E|nr:glutamate receptor 2.1 [Rosa chinensis]
MANNNQYLLIIFMLLDVCLICGNSSAVGEDGTGRKSQQMVNVGVILDLGTPVGKTAQRCISMALSEFYARNANYRTKLNLTVKDSRNDVVSAASAALELLNNEEVQAIIGPQTSNQAKFVTSLGEKAQIPIISFSATSPSLSPTMNRFFIRTALDDSFQVKAITSIVKAYGWHEVVLIYEDTEYGNGLIPYIIDAFQQIDTRVPYRSVISPSSSRLNILRKLNKLMAMETRVFLVHMTPSLGSKLFVLAKDAGMMSEGYAWIITDGLSSVLHPLEGNVIDSMEGVVGVTPYVPMSTGLDDFEMRWKQSTIGTTKQTHSKISIFGLWAYDTVWALAKAVELVELQANYSSALKNNNKGKSSGGILSQIGVSKSGPRLLQTLLRTRFEGLSGRFRLIDQQFQPAAFKIFNVIGKRERVIGYWTPNKESFDDLVQSGMLTNYSSTSIAIDDHREFIIKVPIWPGNTSTPPKGWDIPVTGKKLRIGVPVTSDSYNEFMKIKWFPHTNEPKSFSGFSYDVFLAALERVPFALPHKFIPFTNVSSREAAGTYDDLLYQIKLNAYGWW